MKSDQLMGLLLLLVLLVIETEDHRTWYLNPCPQRGSMKQEFAVTGNFLMVEIGVEA